MSGKVFLDTNILVYTTDKHYPKKMSISRALLTELCTNQKGVISTQVMQEFYVTVTRKLKVEPLVAKNILHSLEHMEIITVIPEIIKEAIDCQIIHQLSFWDALIIVTAESAGCEFLFSEDLNSGQIIRGVTIKNPFEN